jgi:hypothetical protein
MSDHCIQLLALAVQTLALIGLGIYCIETYKIRKASIGQIESQANPCITFWAQLRDGADAILAMHGATGNLVAQPDGGSYVIQNLGNGLALNLRYRITRNIPELEVNQREWRYIPTIAATARATLVETLGGYNMEHEATFEYESIGGRNYRSTIALNHHVITSFKFEEIEGSRVGSA